MGMNYLAHLYLSGENDFLKIGNFIGDAIKGKQYQSYPENIRNGILLHRKIDSFTDTHPIVKKSIHRLRPKYGLYSGVIVDMLYDYFLASHWNKFHSKDLEEYAADFYTLLATHLADLPERIQQLYPYMIRQNWLVQYATLPGMKMILKQMNGRVKKDIKMHEAIQDLKKDPLLFEEEFFAFFAELEAFVKEQKEFQRSKLNP